MKKWFVGARRRTPLGWKVGFWLGILAPLSIFGQGSPDIIWSQSNGNSDRINAVIFSLDGNTVISGGSDRLINFWNAANGNLIRTLDSSAAAIHNSSVEALALSPDGARLASVNFQTVKVWRLADGSLQTLSGHTDWVVGCAYSPNGLWLATASFDGTVRIWRGSDGSAIKVLRDPAQVRAVAFSPDSRLMASGGGDNILYVRQTSDWSTVYQLAGHVDDIDAIAFSPDGSMVATGSYDRTVRIWNVSDGSLRAVIGNNSGTIYSVAFSPDSSILAYTDGEGNTVRLVRTSDGAVTHTYTTNVNAVQTLAFSPSGMLAYGRVDRTVVLANVGTGGGGGGGGSTPPSVTLLSPPSGHTYPAGAAIPISARVSANGGVAQVEFFANSQSLDVLTGPPFTFQWTNAAPGSYTVTATVTDKLGATASDNLSITVNDPPPDKTRPSVTITSPTPNLRLQSNTITLMGKAGDNVGVGQVLVSLNSADFQPAAGTTAWSASLVLAPGLNTVRVKSVDLAGNESAITSRSFTYVVSSVLTVNISGTGKVTPDYSGKLLEAGKRYTLRAVPGTGMVFDGWTGNVTSNSSSINFTMPGVDSSLQANFVPNPFIPLVGTYRGLATSDPPAIEGAGYGQFTLASSGSFSGRLYYNGGIFSLNGVFQPDGTFATSIAIHGQAPLGVALQLHVADASQQITGTISNGVTLSTLSADLATFNAKTNPAPQAGRYTFILPANPNGSGPDGTGYGTVTINTAGSVSVSGRLPDGTSISQSTALAKDGTWPFFQWLSSGKQVLAGEVKVDVTMATSDMDGSIHWFRDAMPTHLFPGGFDTQVSFMGSLYTPAAKGSPVLDVSTNAGSTQVTLQGGDLNNQVVLPATLDLHDHLTSFPAADRNVSASFTRSTGLFSGSFLNPTTSKNTPFNGVIFQKQNIGSGFFLGTDQSGSVLINGSPATP